MTSFTLGYICERIGIGRGRGEGGHGEDGDSDVDDEDFGTLRYGLDEEGSAGERRKPGYCEEVTGEGHGEFWAREGLLAHFIVST